MDIDTPTQHTQHPIQQHPSIIQSQIDEDKVLFNATTGETVGLSPVSTTIWDLLHTPKTLDELCDALMNQYDVSEEQCKRETKAIVDQLLEKNFLQTHASATP